MQKFVRIVSIVSVVLVSISLLLLLITIPIQGDIAQLLGYSESTTQALPQFPFSRFLPALLLLGCMIFQVICSSNNKIGIWSEIIAFICLAAIVPVISYLLSIAPNILQTRSGQSDYVILARSVVSTISYFLMLPAGLGEAIAIANCGMGIVYKKMSKSAAICNFPQE